jgi:hypothetical protein
LVLIEARIGCSSVQGAQCADSSASEHLPGVCEKIMPLPHNLYTEKYNTITSTFIHQQERIKYAQ